MLKLLIIGACGNMGKNHLRVARKYLRTTEHELMTCDSNVKDTAPDFKDYKVAIAGFEPTHVVIAAPTQLHEEMLDYCVKKKVKNVLVEKPIIEKGNTNKYTGLKYTKIMVGHTERFNPMVGKLIQLLNGRKVDTVICTRAGLLNDKNRTDLNTDLCIHDSDVCQLITRENIDGDCRYEHLSADIKAGSCNLTVKINGATCFLHADERSPFKLREIKVMGPGYIIVGDYMNQSIIENGNVISITKSEPLLSEYDTFLTSKFTESDLKEAIQNLRIVSNE